MEQRYAIKETRGRIVDVLSDVAAQRWLFDRHQTIVGHYSANLRQGVGGPRNVVYDVPAEYQRVAARPLGRHIARVVDAERNVCDVLRFGLGKIDCDLRSVETMETRGWKTTGNSHRTDAGTATNFQHIDTLLCKRPFSMEL